MKKLLVIIFLLFPVIAVNAHYDYGRYDRNQPDLGLPEGNSVLIGLLIGIVAIVIGQILVRNGDNSKENNPAGCIGVILHFVGFIGHVPLLMWICAIGQAVLSIVIVIGVILFIIGLIYYLFSKK